MSESAISHSIRQYLISQNVMVERIQSGTLRVGAGRAVRYVHCAGEGTPDLWCSLFGGCFLEVKTPTGRLREAQLLWHERARNAGVRVYVIRNVIEVQTLMRLQTDGQ